MKPVKEILYLSNLCSPLIEDYLIRTSTTNPGQAAQKFNRLLALGLSMHDDCCVESWSVIPVNAKIHAKRIWKIKSEYNGHFMYNYIPFINILYIREILIFIYTFLKVVFWNFAKRQKNRIIICDILSLSISLAAQLACKFTSTKIIAITTDIPGIMLPEESNISFKTKLYNKLSRRYIINYNGYILLTEQMNEIVNPHNRPYIIMEGIVDIQMSSSENLLSNKAPEKILIYSGGIFEIYGVKKLIDAFMKLEDNDLRLHIYGSGDMEKDMTYYSAIDNRIVYKGLVSNFEVVNNQINATLLINPRPSNEDYTKYSFPSKNIEYMVSGTPSITTPLPGMPKEYNKFVYLFNDESVDGIYEMLKYLISKPKEELHEFGYLAKQFVLMNKNNIVQAKRVLSLFEGNHS